MRFDPDVLSRGWTAWETEAAESAVPAHASSGKRAVTGKCVQCPDVFSPGNMIPLVKQKHINMSEPLGALSCVCRYRPPGGSGVLLPCDAAPKTKNINMSEPLGALSCVCICGPPGGISTSLHVSQLI